jgi:hypothetical protein
MRLGAEEGFASGEATRICVCCLREGAVQDGARPSSNAFLDFSLSIVKARRIFFETVNSGWQLGDSVLRYQARDKADY